MVRDLVQYFKDFFPIVVLIGATVVILGVLALTLRRIWGGTDRGRGPRVFPR
jgi:hypothetical protein